MSPVRTALVAAWLIIACGTSGCEPTRLPSSELDPQATFAAHQVHAGFLLDRLPDSDTGIVEPPTWINLSGTPRFRVRTTRGTQGTLRVTSPAGSRSTTRGRSPLPTSRRAGTTARST